MIPKGGGGGKIIFLGYIFHAQSMKVLFQSDASCMELNRDNKGALFFELYQVVADHL